MVIFSHNKNGKYKISNDLLFGDDQHGALLEFDCERDYVFGEKRKLQGVFIQASGQHTHYQVLDLPLIYEMQCIGANISVQWCGIKPKLTDAEGSR